MPRGGRREGAGRKPKDLYLHQLHGTWNATRHGPRPAKPLGPNSNANSKPATPETPDGTLAARSAEDHDALRTYFLSGTWPAGSDLDLQFSVPAAQLHAWWGVVRERVLSRYVEACPGQRPWAWWQWDAPEPRQRVGGVGDASHDVLAESRSFRFGIPASFITRALAARLSADFRGIAVDPMNPPAYESQAAFIGRHGSWFEGERERVDAGAFQPERAGAIEQ